MSRLEDAFKARVRKAGACLEWTGWMGQDGYGRYRPRGHARHMQAHRYAYITARGEIPPGLCIDHLCRNRRCVNPDHLEAVTIRENIMRGVSRIAQNAVATSCLRGHSLTDEANVYVTANGSRQCRQCCVLRTHAYRNRLKESRQ